MTKATPKKKTTTTKKKPTVKAHRGFAHVPLRGRRRPPIQRRPVGDPPRRRPMTPAQRDALRRQQELARRRFNQRRGQPQPFTPAMRDLARRQSEAARKRMQQLTPAQKDRLMKQITAEDRRRQQQLSVLPIRRRPTVEQLSNARRRRRPVGDPKPRRRVIPARKQVKQATQAPRTRPKSRRV